MRSWTCKAGFTANISVVPTDFLGGGAVVRRLAVLGLLLLLTAGCDLRQMNRPATGLAAGQKAPPVADPRLSAPERETISARAANAVAALAKRDLGRLSALVHPSKGVRFSPYGHIDPTSDRVLSPQQLQAAWTDESVHLWGYEDGTGEPIRQNFRDYFDRFVYDADFAQAEQVALDTILGRGSTLNNLAQVYPGARFVEYHFSGFNPRYQGLDWKSLRLIFEQAGGVWYLVGIVHDQWTI